MRRQISAAARVVAMLASAPSPASRPDQTRRLTISLSMRPDTKRLGVSSVQPAADSLDDEAGGAVVGGLVVGEQAEDPARQDLLDGAVESHGRELGGDVARELAALLRLGDD